ncbi:rRNA maturation RNase YbeY [Virgibacillus sp. W0181]|uniref:rRNA maturation RNase YbeY n=1 Tax=Virgibacillus sp. W0181 TaxID=3391581 RepID=UPI003F447276
MHIDFHDKTKSITADDIDLLQRIIEYAGKTEGVSHESELSINFVDNREMQELNRNYRQQDNPTDVISFALQDSVDGEVSIVGKDIPLLLGDIVISVEKAKEQAITYDHSLQREIGFLAVHGFLHLLGYDHYSEENERIMFNKQDEILGAFKLER